MWLSIRCGRVLCLLLWLWLVFGILCNSCRVLARDIQTDDGVINACLSEAAERLQELSILVDLYKVMAENPTHWMYAPEYQPSL